MRINSTAIIIFFLCTGIFSSGCAVKEEFIGTTYNSYRVSLLPVNGTAIVYVPIAMNEDGTVSDVMKNLTAYYPNGTRNPNAVTEVIDTEHGKALKIITHEHVEVRNSVYGKGTIDQNFSMWNGILPSEEYYAIPIGSVWIYLDNSSTAEHVSVQHLEIDTSYSIVTGNVNAKILIDHPVNHITVLNDGWNAYPIYKMRY